VFVAQPIPEPALNLMRQEAEVTVYPYMDRQITVDELAAAARRSNWLFVMHETNVTADVINANPDLQGIGVMARSETNIDMAAANARKLPVIGEESEASYDGVGVTTADLTVAMLLGLAYRVLEADRYTRCGNFRQEQTMALLGTGCPGATVGLIGCGRVGQHLAPRIRAFDMYTTYTKRTRLVPERERELDIEWVPELDDLLTRSDFVCIACDYNESTHKLIGARELGLMKRGAFLINTARGRIVDEAALITALQRGQIAGAGLDVYWNEPPYTQDPGVPEALRKLDNVILCPHNGGATWAVRTSKTLSVARGMIEMMGGRRARSLLNPEIYEGR
jgi:glyoxylate reductase